MRSNSAAIGWRVDSKALLDTGGAVFVPLCDCHLLIANCRLECPRTFPSTSWLYGTPRFIKSAIGNRKLAIPPLIFNPIIFHPVRNDRRCGYQLFTITVGLEFHAEPPRFIARFLRQSGPNRYSLIVKPGVEILHVTQAQITGAFITER